MEEDVVKAQIDVLFDELDVIIFFSPVLASSSESYLFPS
jgi:hypothetical protein